MDDFMETSPLPPPVPLTEREQVRLADEIVRRLAGLPIPPGALFTRILWVIIIGPSGFLTRASLPIDNRSGRPELAAIGRYCDLIARLMTRNSLLGEDETVLVVLRRPGTATVSDADRYIFRLLCEAAARRDTAPWTFCVATPHGRSNWAAPDSIVAVRRREAGS